MSYSKVVSVTFIKNNVCALVTNCLCDPKWYSSEHTHSHESIYITLFQTRHNESINDDKKAILIHRPRVSLVRFTFCWWRHNRLLMTSQIVSRTSEKWCLTCLISFLFAAVFTTGRVINIAMSTLQPVRSHNRNRGNGITSRCVYLFLFCRFHQCYFLNDCQNISTNNISGNVFTVQGNFIIAL